MVRMPKLVASRGLAARINLCKLTLCLKASITPRDRVKVNLGLRVN